MFTTQVSQWIFNTLKTYYDEYKKLPTRNVYDTELSKEDAWQPLPEELLLLQEFLSLLTSGVITDSDYIKNSILQYISSKAMRTTLSEQSENIDTGEFEGVISSLRAIRRQLILDEGGLIDEFGNVFSLNNLKSIYLRETAIKTGFGLIDQGVKGVVAKELTLVAADTGVGKSNTMIQMGSYMVKNLKKVLHVTLEMSAARVLSRYLAMFSAYYPEYDWVCIDDILANDKDLAPKLHEYVARFLREKFEGLLHIEELPTGKGSLEQITNLVDRHRPHVLIIDYLDLLKPPRAKEALRFELKDITSELRALGIEYAIPVLSATQTNRIADEKRIIKKRMIAEDYEKLRLADTVIGIGQNATDKDKYQYLFYLIKTRNADGEKGEFYTFDKRKLFFKFQRPWVIDRKEEVDGATRGTSSGFKKKGS